MIWSTVSGDPEASPPAVEDEDAEASVETSVDATDVGAALVAPVEAAVLFALVVPAVEPPATVPELLQAAVAKTAPATTPTAALLTPNPMPIPHFDEMHALIC